MKDSFLNENKNIFTSNEKNVVENNKNDIGENILDEKSHLFSQLKEGYEEMGAINLDLAREDFGV